MVMRKLLLNKVKTATKKLGAPDADTHCAYAPDVRLSVWISRVGYPLPLSGAPHAHERCAPTMRMTHTHGSCAGEKTEDSPRSSSGSGRARARPWPGKLGLWCSSSNGEINAQGAHACGQPVQNLCLPWAQYMGVGHFVIRASLSPKYVVKVTAIIFIIH